jgi:hypothetical protein
LVFEGGSSELIEPLRALEPDQAPSSEFATMDMEKCCKGEFVTDKTKS